MRPRDELAARRIAKREAALSGPTPTDLQHSLEEMDRVVVAFLDAIDGELLTSVIEAQRFALRLDRLVLDQLNAIREKEAR